MSKNQPVGPSIDQVSGPGGERGAERDDLADHAVDDELLGLHVQGREPLIVADHQHLVRLLARGDHRLRLRRRSRHRLLAEHVLARGEGGDRYRSVKGVGGTDAHGVDALHLQRVLVVAERLRLVLLGELLRALRHAIDESANLDVGMRRVLRPVTMRGDAAASDHGHADLLFCHQGCPL